MTASFHRRDFLKTSAGLVAGVGLAGGRLPAEVILFPGAPPPEG